MKKRALLLSFLLVTSIVRADWDLVKKRAEQAATAAVIVNEVHKQISPERRAKEEAKQKKIKEQQQKERERQQKEYQEFQKMLGQSSNSNNDLESQVANIFGAALSGQGSSAASSVKTFVPTYLNELQQKYASEYKTRYKKLANGREVKAKFDKVYPYNIQQQIMALPSKEEAKRALDNRYQMLW